MKFYARVGHGPRRICLDFGDDPESVLDSASQSGILCYQEIGRKH